MYIYIIYIWPYIYIYDCYVEPPLSNMFQHFPPGLNALWHTSQLRPCPDASLNCQRRRRWNTPVAQRNGRSSGFYPRSQQWVANNGLMLGTLEHDFYVSVYWECHNPNWLMVDFPLPGLIARRKIVTLRGAPDLPTNSYSSIDVPYSFPVSGITYSFLGWTMNPCRRTNIQDPLARMSLKRSVVGYCRTPLWKYLVGGFKHFFHNILGIILPTDFHIFQDG